MLEQRIQQHFFESADLQYQAAEVMSRPVAEAVQAIVACVTAGGRLLVGGRGAAAGLAALLLDGIDVDWSRQVETLGQPGDLLLLIDTDGDAPALVAAAEAAQGKDMTVIALTGRSGGALRGVLGETDVLVAVPHDRRARVLEAQLLVLHCLCDSIDLQLLGEEDPA
jgi:D-sedoheptulose 7-phosphate isomerase